ncbi:MAG: glycosyltransferase family 4 protein [Opitutaceae bacterium]
MESPSANTVVAPGWQQLRGWLVPKHGFHFVDIRARIGAQNFPGVYGFPRADLAAHFESTRPWLPAEYTIAIELPVGPIQVAIEALTITARWEPVQTVTCTAQGIPTARAMHDPLGAEEFALAAELSLKQVPAPDDQRIRALAASLPHPSALRPNHPPFHGFIDEPAALSPALYGRLHVLGWLFHETLPIKRAYVSTDLLVFQHLEIGGDFAGVRERFPKQPHARDCRIFGFADVSSQLPSPVTARFYAELEDGSMHLALAVQCRAIDTEELKSPFPPFSSTRFFRNRRMVGQAIADRGIPVEKGGKRWPQLRRDFVQYRREAPTRRDSTGTLAAFPAAPACGNKPRLLLITHNLNREGAPLLLVEYARHLAKNHGAQLLVVSGQDGPLRDAFGEVGATVDVVDTAHFLAASSPAELRGRISAVAKERGWAEFDAIIANTLFSFWGVELASVLGCGSLLYIHESTNPVTFFRERIPAGLLPAVFQALEAAAAVSFNTPATQKYYQPYASGKNFQLTSAWIDLSDIGIFRAAHSTRARRDQLNLRPDELLVANVGTVCDRKGQHDFLRAVEWLWRSSPELARRCRFAMIGGRDTPYNRFLQQSVADTGRANIEIISETNRAYDYFGAADLFVCTSYEESFPRVVLEAMAFEVPIVSTNVHGIPYMLRNGEEAWLVNPGDINALTTAMRSALEQPDLAKSRANHARRRVTEFDAAAVLPKHAALTLAVAQSQA